MNETEQSLEENTQATEQNTIATISAATGDAHPGFVRIQIAQMVVCFTAIAVTGLIAVINPKFAENQAAVILSGVVAGAFGASQLKR